MAMYNYGYPYGGLSQYGNNNYQPMSNINSQNQQALNPFYQAPVVSPINNQRFNAFFVNDYSEVKNAVVSSDGSPSLFMMNDKDIFYIKKVGEDGRTILKSYQFSEYTEDNADKVSNDKNEIETLKQEINNIKDVINSLIINLQSNVKKEKGVDNDDKQRRKFTANDF